TIAILPLMPTAAKFLADSSPDARVKIGELPGSMQLERIAGMGEGDVIDLSDSARPPREKDHALAERDRFAQVMRDKENRLSVARPDVDQFLLQDQPGLGVQGAKRFVHQDNLRVVSQGANEGGALAHASGDLVREIVFEAGKTNRLDQLVSPDLALRRRNAVDFHASLDALQHGSAGKKCVALEHITD